LVEIRKHQVTSFVVDFSGGVNVAEAENVATYALTTAGNRGSFVGRNVMTRKLSSATYNAGLDEVTLTPRLALALTKPTQRVIHGSLQDSTGAFVDGGDNAVFVVSRKAVSRA
jgi:hypothetical protein